MIASLLLVLAASLTGEATLIPTTELGGVIVPHYNVETSDLLLHFDGNHWRGPITEKERIIQLEKKFDELSNRIDGILKMITIDPDENFRPTLESYPNQKTTNLVNLILESHPTQTTNLIFSNITETNMVVDPKWVKLSHGLSEQIELSDPPVQKRFLRIRNGSMVYVDGAEVISSVIKTNTVPTFIVQECLICRAIKLTNGNPRYDIKHHGDECADFTPKTEVVLKTNIVEELTFQLEWKGNTFEFKREIPLITTTNRFVLDP